MIQLSLPLYLIDLDKLPPSCYIFLEMSFSLLEWFEGRNGEFPLFYIGGLSWVFSVVGLVVEIDSPLEERAKTTVDHTTEFVRMAAARRLAMLLMTNQPAKEPASQVIVNTLVQITSANAQSGP